MKIKRIKLLIGLVILTGAAGLLASCSFSFDQFKAPARSFSPQVGENSGSGWFQDHILVGYENEENLNAIAAVVKGRVGDRTTALRIARILLPENLSVTKAITQLLENRPAGLRYAEPNYIREAVRPESVGALEPELLQSLALQSQQAGRYNDPLQSRQWALQLMQAEQAWQSATGRGIIIGIVDTGIDGTHPELIGKQVDGMSCSDGEPIPANTDGTQDSNTHATHVSGIAAAAANNRFGIVGVAPDAQIMSLRIFDANLVDTDNASGYAGDDKVAECILWGATIGPDGIENSGDEADVLNNSWGGRGYSQSLKEGIDKVIASGVAFVNSMGNSGSDEALAPKFFPGVLGVGATNALDGKADFSTMAPFVSVGAPGDDIISSVPQWLLRADESPFNFQYFDGTSMAAPQVSGAIALILQKFPEATPYQLKKILETTADDIEAPGFDRLTGWGRINLARAVSVSSLPALGANVVVSVVTQNPGDSDEDGDIDENDGPVGVPFTDVLLRDQNGNERYYAQTSADGKAEFFSIDPGTYDVLIAGGDTLAQYFRPANRLMANTQVTAVSGQTAEVAVQFNTSLSVSITWAGSANIGLLVAEPRAGSDPEWVGANDASQWGTFSVSAGAQSYSLNAVHYPNAVYRLALSAEGSASAADVTVTIVQNGISESFGPFPVQPGETLESTEWEGWWENTPDEDLGFEDAGPGGPWVY